MSEINNEVNDRFVSFKIGDEIYGIAVRDVQEVLSAVEISPIPGSPIHVLGLINLRGNVVTVINTRSLLDLPDKEINDETRIIIINLKNGQVIGAIADSVSEVLGINIENIEPSPNIGTSNESAYITGVVSKEDELLILISMDKLLEDKTF